MEAESANENDSGCVTGPGTAQPVTRSGGHSRTLLKNLWSARAKTVTRRNDKPAPEKSPREKGKEISGGFPVARRTAQDGKGRAGGRRAMLAAFRTAARDRQQRLAIPFRPVLTGGGSLCAEQLADLKAAQQGSITWAQYFHKWGPSL